MKSIDLEKILVKNIDTGTSFSLDELLVEISNIEKKCEKIPISGIYEKIIPLHKKLKQECLNKKEYEIYNSLLYELKEYYSIKNQTKNKFKRKDLIEIDLKQQKKIIEYKELLTGLYSKLEDFYFHINPFLENKNLMYINTHSSLEEEQREYAEKLYNFLFIVSPQGFPNGDLSGNKMYYEEIRKVDIAKEFLIGDVHSIDVYLNPKRYNNSKYFFENVETIEKSVDRIKSLNSSH